jgi:hypothetical protein
MRRGFESDLWCRSTAERAVPRRDLRGLEGVADLWAVAKHEADDEQLAADARQSTPERKVARP